jgi:hypothetical protein
MNEIMTDNRELINVTRSRTYGKLGPIPRELGRTGITRTTYRYKVPQFYNLLPTQMTSLNRKKQFSNWARSFLRNPSDILADHSPQLLSLEVY